MKSLENYRSMLTKRLYEDALEEGIFAEAEVLKGTGDFYELHENEEERNEHYWEFITEFEDATERRILGGKVGEEVPAIEMAPDLNLTEKEYMEALIDVFFAAQAGVVLADDWMLYDPGTDGYNAKLNYAEMLAYNAGMNAWSDWLCDNVEFEDEDECEAFMNHACHFYHKEFFEEISELRTLMAEEME